MARGHTHHLGLWLVLRNMEATWKVYAKRMTCSDLSYIRDYCGCPGEQDNQGNLPGRREVTAMVHIQMIVGATSWHVPPGVVLSHYGPGVVYVTNRVLQEGWRTAFEIRF